MSEPAVEVNGVTKRFGDSVALHPVDFTVEPGEFVSILGPSGCGKTTLLRIISGFETPSAGTVRIQGEDVTDVPPHRRPTNIVFQRGALFPHMNVFDNVAFGPRSRKESESAIKARVNEMLEVVRLGEFATRRPSQLSGGQQQRVALARALVNLPSALLLDEPLGALDLKLREAMQIELKRIQREVGITFIFVTHDQHEALTMSDRIAVMSQGRVEQIGTPEEIYHRPASVFVAGFIGTANLLPAKVVEVTASTVTVVTRAGASISTDADQRRFAIDQDVTVMIRPERLQLTRRLLTQSGVDHLAVTLTDLIFQGASSKAILCTADGTELVGDIELDDEARSVRPGDELFCTWGPGSAYLLSETTQHAGATSTDVDVVEAHL